jgi:hypothetical protein
MLFGGENSPFPAKTLAAVRSMIGQRILMKETIYNILIFPDKKAI